MKRGHRLVFSNAIITLTALALVLLLVTSDDQFTFDEGRMAERLCLAAAACGLGATVACFGHGEPLTHAAAAGLQAAAARHMPSGTGQDAMGGQFGMTYQWSFTK